MKDIGVRLARQRLLRYRVPTPDSVRWRRWILAAAVVWGLWAVFLSDHSVMRLAKLQSDRDRLAVQASEATFAYNEVKDRVPNGELTDAQAERVLRERHNFARKDELVYVIGEDTMRAQNP